MKIIQGRRFIFPYGTGEVDCFIEDIISIWKNFKHYEKGCKPTFHGRIKHFGANYLEIDESTVMHSQTWEVEFDNIAYIEKVENKDKNGNEKY